MTFYETVKVGRWMFNVQSGGFAGLYGLARNRQRCGAFFLGPILYNLHDLADISAFALGIAGLEKFLVQAITGAGILSGQSLGKHRSIVKIPENTGGNG